MDLGEVASDRAALALERTEADQELLRGWLSGGDVAFAALYRRLSPPLFSMVYGIVGHQKDAEDVLQETFVQMWKQAATYDAERGNVFTWSVMIARNRAIDRVRARQRRQRLIEAAAAEFETVAPSGATIADDLLGHREEREQVSAALRRIPAVQRAAIDLAFFRGLTQGEIAEKLGAPLGTIKARIRRGLLALRDLLAGGGLDRPILASRSGRAG